MNVLLVEDDEVDIVKIKKSIEKADFASSLNVARDGLEALDFLHKHKNEFFIIILDLQMPKMDGFEFLERLRATPNLKDMPVIILTGSQYGKDIEKAYQYNVAGYIAKSTTEENIFDDMTIVGNYWGVQVLPQRRN